MNNEEVWGKILIFFPFIYHLISTLRRLLKLTEQHLAIYLSDRLKLTQLTITEQSFLDQHHRRSSNQKD